MTKINLREILYNKLKESKYGIPELDSDAYENIVKAMKEACKQALELAIQTVETETIEYYGKFYEEINKQSILNVLNLVE